MALKNMYSDDTPTRCQSSNSGSNNDALVRSIHHGSGGDLGAGVSDER